MARAGASLIYWRLQSSEKDPARYVAI